MLSPNQLWRKHSGYKGGVQSRQCVSHGIFVGDIASVQSTIVATGSPSVFVLGDQVERRSPGAVGTPGSAISEHLFEFGFRDSEAVWF